MGLTLSENNLREIETAFKTKLDDAFQGEFEFGPITAKQVVNLYGQDNVEVIIVVNGEYRRLDPKKTLKVMNEMYDYLEQGPFGFGFDNTMLPGYIHESEYEYWLEISSRPPWERED